MIATQTHTSFPGATTYAHWRGTSTDTAFGQCKLPARAQMEPPRPLEPRATHARAPSTQDSRRYDVFNHRGPTQTLPGVRDILSPPSGPEPWLVGQQPHYLPPSTYPPRPDYAFLQERRIELPILETKHQPVGLAPSLFGNAHLDPPRDYADPRPRQMSNSSYARDSVTSPYTPNYEEPAPRASTVFTPTGADSSRRYVGVRDFGLEGRFHVYEDGHRLPTHVDGEQVNPQWGLTKANKPRKRLALACMDCREKKIKCEPGATSCLQCEKAKRVCRRTTTNTPQDASSTAEWSSNAGSPPASRPAAHVAEPTTPASRDTETEHMQKRRAQEEAVSHNGAVKRPKSASPPSSTIHSIMNIIPPAMPPTTRIIPPDADPYAADPALTMHLLDLYFARVNSGAVYSLFPREPFMHWVVNCTDKGHTERMVLVAMLAMASVFDPQLRGVGEHCASLAATALNAKFGKFSLQLTQIQLLLALYNFAKGSKGVAWEYCGLAVRGSIALRLNNEEGCIAESESDPCGTKEYGLTYHQAVECRRRTFWCGFMMDRFNGFCQGMSCIVNKADVYLRLPCADSNYEKGSRSQAPFFDNGIVERADVVLTSSVPVALMAHLALITSIWGDVMNFVNRGTHRSSSGHAAAYEDFYAETYKALETWSSRLPPHLDYNEQNLARSVREAYAGDFVTMHVLYHYARLKLNRCMRWSLMADKVSRNICEAHQHAHQLLDIVSALSGNKIDFHASPAVHAHRYSFSTPFVGFAILSAIDVISAGGPDSNLKPTIESMREGLAFLRELEPYWSSAADQAKAGEKRFLQLRNVVIRPYKATSGCWLGRKWGLADSLEKEVDLKDDCIYGVEHNVYFEALDKLERHRSPSARAGA